MNFDSARIIIRPVAMFTLGVFLAVGLLGIFTGMEMSKDGKMGSCPFAAGPSVCNMGVFEHIGAWQNTFSLIPVLSSFLAMLASLIASFLIAAYSILRNTPGDQLFLKHFRFKFYIPLPRYGLQEAFSQGILNTKIH